MNQANDEKVNLLLKDCDKFGAVDEQTIKMAEQELEVIFPYQYREFLANFGAVVVMDLKFMDYHIRKHLNAHIGKTLLPSQRN